MHSLCLVCQKLKEEEVELKTIQAESIPGQVPDKLNQQGCQIIFDMGFLIFTSIVEKLANAICANCI